MPVNGTYHVEVSMPGGKGTFKISLKSQGVLVSGYIDGPFGRHDFTGGELRRREVSWTVMLKPQNIPKPRVENHADRGVFGKIGNFLEWLLFEPPVRRFPDRQSRRRLQAMPVNFKALVTDNDIRGEMELGPYGTNPFKGIIIKE
jgi:hypothetical protein